MDAHQPAQLQKCLQEQSTLLWNVILWETTSIWIPHKVNLTIIPLSWKRLSQRSKRLNYSLRVSMKQSSSHWESWCVGGKRSVSHEHFTVIMTSSMRGRGKIRTLSSLKDTLRRDITRQKLFVTCCAKYLLCFHVETERNSTWISSCWSFSICCQKQI